MVKPAEVVNQLHVYHLQRNKNVWIYHLLLSVLSTYFQREKLMPDPYWWMSLLVIFTALLIRILVFNVFYESWLKQDKWALVSNYVALIILSLGWMCHFASVYHAYGPGNAHTSYALIIVAGLITGATVSLVANRNSFYLFTSIMCIVPISIFLSDPQSDKSIVFPILVFYLFNLYNFRIGHGQLRRSIENELRAGAEKERVTRIIDTVPGFVGVANSQGIVTLANQTTLSLYPDILGRKVGEIDPTSGWEKEVLHIMNSDQFSSVTEQHSNFGGQDICVLLNTQKTPDGGAIIVSIIINELVEARKLLKVQEAKSQYSAKLASLGEMAAGIAHEINNPLTIIQGSSTLIKRMIEQGPADLNNISFLSTKVTQTTERISRIVKSLKSLSRNGEDDPFEEINLEKLIVECLEISKTRIANAGIDLRLPSFEKPILFKGRDVQLAQVLMNLISNSIDAVKKSKNPWIELSYYETDHTLDILVKDSGPGVPEAIRDKIMEPFFTTKDVNQGTGLGLSISKSIMDAHHGELILKEGVPTTFVMHLLKNW